MHKCGLDNWTTCLPRIFFQYLADLMNDAIRPLLKFTETLLTAPANVDIFVSLWAVVVYIISIFYGLFFIFAGFNLMISGHDAGKREKAKYWLRNVVLMILFVQASFFLYGLILQVSSLLTEGVMNIIDDRFFLITVDSFFNFGLELSLLFVYLATLIVTIIFLVLRYLLAVIGVVFFPLGIFFYFIPPLQAYGKMILNVLLVIIFVPFFSALILFGASALLQLSIFNHFSTILVIVAFLCVDLLMVVLTVFALLKTAFSVINSETGRNVTKVGKYFL